MFKRFIKKYFDYDLIGDYFVSNIDGQYVHKYKRRYYLKCLRKLRMRKRGVHR